MANPLKLKADLDASDVVRGGKQAESALEDISDAAGRTGKDLDDAFSTGGTTRFSGITTAGSAFGSFIGNLGSQAVGAGISIIGEYKDSILELNATSADTGLSLRVLDSLKESLQGYGDFDLGAIEGLIDRVTELSTSAVAGDSASVEAVGKLGLRVSDLIGPDGLLHDPDELLFTYANGWQNIEDSQKAAGIASELFGDDFDQLKRILDSGTGTLEDILRQQDAWSNPITQEDIDDITELEKKWAEFKDTLGDAGLVGFGSLKDAYDKFVNEGQPAILAALGSIGLNALKLGVAILNGLGLDEVERFFKRSFREMGRRPSIRGCLAKSANQRKWRGLRLP